MKIIHIAALDNKNCIGKNNQLAWHISEDLQHFKALTTGKAIIMGRKTFESLGRPLPNRHNIIITKNPNYQALGCAVVCSLEDAIKHAKTYAKQQNQDEIFIIGGGQIYQNSLNLADILELTHVDLDIGGDAFYPDFSTKFTQIWQSDMKHDKKTGIAFYFARYQKLTNLSD